MPCSHCGIEQVVLLPFGPRLAALGARAFVRELLVDGLGTRFLLVGDDFRFGHGREGDYGPAARPWATSTASRWKTSTPLATVGSG